MAINPDIRADSYYRSMWIATIIHSILFAVISLVALYFRNRAHHGVRLSKNNNGSETNVHDEGTLAGRLADAARLVRDTLIVVTIADVATGLGYGATSTTSVLTWVGVGLSVISVISDATVRHPLVPVAFLAPAYVFFLAVFGLAFRYTETGRVVN